ncbi:MAG: tetratricopeptide repeat protein [Promethearchaeota archaeon]
MLKKEQNFEMELTKARELIITAPVEAEKLLRKLLRWKISVKNELETKIELAYSLWAQGKNKESQQMYEEVYERASELELEEEKADALEGLAGVDIDLGELKRGTDRCHQAIKIFQKLKNKEKEAKTSNTLAIIHFTKGELEEALKWFKKTRRLAKDTQSLTIAHVLSNMGLIHHARGEFEKAAKYYAESVELSRSLKSARGICITQNNLGDALQQMGEYVEAHKNYEQALQLARDTKDKKNIALLSQSLANLLVDLGELKKAYPLFKTAVKIYDDVGEATGRIRAYIGLAYYWLIKGQLEKAKRILQDALQIIEETGVIESQVEVLVSLAETTVGLNEIDEAYEFLKQANKLAQERASDLDQASVLIQRGRINVNELEFNEAEILLEEARWLAGKINQLNLQFRADMLLAQNFLMRYLQDTTKSHYYEQALSLNTEAMILAKERRLIPNYVDALVIQGLLYSLQGDFENAKSSLSEALKLAKEKGMTVQVQLAKERLSIISGKQLNIASNEHLRSIVMALAMDQLKRATATYVESAISEEDLAESFLV